MASAVHLGCFTGSSTEDRVKSNLYASLSICCAMYEVSRCVASNDLADLRAFMFRSRDHTDDHCDSLCASLVPSTTLSVWRALPFRMDAVTKESEEMEGEQPDSERVCLAEGHLVDVNQAIAWLRHSWQFATIVYSIRMLAGPLHLQRLSTDQLEQALVKPKLQHSVLAELLVKLSWPTSSGKVLGDDLHAWEKVLSERLRAIYGDDDIAHTSLLDKPWLNMSLQEKVTFRPFEDRRPAE